MAAALGGAGEGAGELGEAGDGMGWEKDPKIQKNWGGFLGIYGVLILPR